MITSKSPFLHKHPDLELPLHSSPTFSSVAKTRALADAHADTKTQSPVGKKSSPSPAIDLERFLWKEFL